MITNKEVKLITSLTQKKYRNKHLLFVAEGEKLVSDLVNSKYQVQKIYYTEVCDCVVDEDLTSKITAKELKRMSSLKSPSSILGVFRIPSSSQTKESGLQLVLDDLQDPGNLGTIIRLCDWFGVSNLICSLDTVDCYNPKVVQASMGSLANVSVSYQDIESFIKKSKSSVFTTDMNGEQIYGQQLPKNAILVMGNEGKGVRDSIKKLANTTLTIPRFGTQSKAESLNVATATAILLSEFRREI